MTLKIGLVKYFDQINGCGFITPIDGSSDVYVTKKAIASEIKYLVQGQKVEFSVQKSSRGPEAADVIIM